MKSENDNIEFYFISQFSSFDWVIEESGAKSYMSLPLSFRDKDNGSIFYYETYLTLGITIEMLERPERYFPFIIPSSTDKLTAEDNHISSLSYLPTGKYIVDAYLKNIYTLKYNAWTIDVEKK